jgi:hypothetical protein
MPGELVALAARAGDAQTDPSIDAMVDQLPSVCRQNGGAPYVLYDYDDNGSVSCSRVSCFGQKFNTRGNDWLCEVDHTGEWFCITLASQPPRPLSEPTSPYLTTLAGAYD